MLVPENSLRGGGTHNFCPSVDIIVLYPSQHCGTTLFQRVVLDNEADTTSGCFLCLNAPNIEAVLISLDRSMTHDRGGGHC